MSAVPFTGRVINRLVVARMAAAPRTTFFGVCRARYLSAQALRCALWALLTCLVAPTFLFAEQLPIRIFTSADGLGSSFVDSVMRDSRGFMWFCTRDGLSRFDGARFVTYHVGKADAPPGVEGITETSGGVYWISTTGGLYRLRADAMTRPDKVGANERFLNAEFIGNWRGIVLEDRIGTLWFTGGSVHRIRDENGKVEFEDVDLDILASPGHALAAFQSRQAPDGSLWISTNEGMARRLPDGRIILYRHKTNLRGSNVGMVIENNGRVWAGWGSEIFVICPEPIESAPQIPFSVVSLPEVTNAEIEPNLPVNLPDAPGRVLHLSKRGLGTQALNFTCSSDGHIWMVSDRDLLEFDGRIFNFFNGSHGLPLGMSTLAEDSAGNMWIGSRTGVARLARKSMTTFGEMDGLKSRAIFAISEGADGTLYFATGGFNLSRLDGNRFITTRPGVAPNARSLWSSRYAFLSSANEWWILTADGTYRFSAGNLRYPLAIYDQRNGLAANEAFQISEDSHGDIWLSQQPSQDENIGLYRLKRGETVFHRFTVDENFPQGRAVSSFAEDRVGNLWFGFYEGGLARFSNGKFELFTEEDGLPGGLIIDLRLDHSGRLWLASTSGGLRRVDDPTSAKLSFIPITAEDGLASNNTRTLTEDQFGNIYVGSVRGVDRISPDGRIRHFSVSDGLAADFVVDSICDRSGALWFATTNGLSRLRPQQDPEVSSPRILLGGLRIAGEAQPISELGDAGIQLGDLEHNRNNLEIDFFGIEFQPGETLRYQYRLEGADSDWSAPTEQRSVTFANLRPGSYRFLVRATTSAGAVSANPAVVDFRIVSPVWQRWWFIATFTLLVCVLFYLFYKYRTGNLRRVNAALAEAKRAEEELGRARQERLAELTRVRTRIASDLHDDIGSSLTQIAILSEVAQRTMHENGYSIEHLKSITNVSNNLVETMSDIVWAINPRKDHLQDLVQRMRRFASDLFPARGINFEFDTPAYAPEIPLGANARREIFLIFKEMVNNVVKHANASNVKIEFRFLLDSLILEVSDDGSGFSGEPYSTTVYPETRGGNGLHSMKKRAAEMNGRFTIDSDFGKGTTALLEIPVDRHTRHSGVPIQTDGDNA